MKHCTYRLKQSQTVIAHQWFPPTDPRHVPIIGVSKIAVPAPGEVSDAGFATSAFTDTAYVIDTYRGSVTLQPGDYVIMQPNGQRVVYSEEIFLHTYEPAVQVEIGSP